jgi:hypothetical protein
VDAPTTSDYVIMLIATAFCIGAMFAVLIWFFRRLRGIEEATWGEHGHESLRALMKETLYRIRHGARGG